jgi:multiple sugar transport system ATP-binding protein
LASVSIERVSKVYKPGADPVSRDIDLEIRDGEFFILLGPSGCGKSTLLRMIAGLERATAGRIKIADTIVDAPESGTFIEPKNRDIAMVFQSYALYPHMTVYDNMCFGLKLRGTDKALIDSRVRAAAETLGLAPYLERLPKELSGGQRQRVALGRALVREPKVFLLDEPLSNLDAKLRGNMRVELRRLQARLATTMIYVTHDQVEAMTLGDRIAVFNGGTVQQVGRPLEIYNRPVNLFVAGFLGSPPMNFLKGSAEKRTLKLNGEQSWILPERMSEVLGAKRQVVVGIRPEDFVVGKGNEGAIKGEVVVSEALGDHTDVFVKLTGDAEGTLYVARAPADKSPPAPGAFVSLHPKLERVHLFDAGSGENIGLSTLPKES